MSRDVLLSILDLARWAPSGDNTQPWRFEIAADDRILIHGHDTREHVLYDFDGHPSQMAHGALLETLRLAATRFGLKAEWRIIPDQPDTAPIYEVHLHPSDIPEDPLVRYIEKRTVQRRAMRTTPLTQEQKDALVAAVGPDYSLQFFESFKDRLAVARLLWKNAYIRLTCPEAYPVHRDIIEWNARYSTDRIPDQAIGVDPLTAKLMQWVMKSWERVDFFNRYVFGTIAPRIELDFIPAIACSSHILVRSNLNHTRLVDYVEVGKIVQRLWLTASQHRLHLQPEMTPVIFYWYVQNNRAISHKSETHLRSIELARQFQLLTPTRPDDHYVFLLRIGHCPPPYSRSIRKNLSILMAR